MIDSDLADLYGVSTKNLTRQVRRHLERFPEDFMFQINKDEILRCQYGASSHGGRRYLPYAFTEHGVAMLSSVLNSKKSIAVNIEIMRVFVRMKRQKLIYQDLKKKLSNLEKKYDKQFHVIFKAIEKLIDHRQEKRN